MTGEGKPRRTDPARRGSAAAQTRAAPAAATDVEITLRAMHFQALVGILEHERSVPQPIDVDLTAWCSGSAGIVDYRHVYDAVQDVLSTGPIDYLEDVANRVAARALEDDRVRRVRVAVRKPHVALPGPLAYAEVVVQRGRQG